MYMRSRAFLTFGVVAVALFASLADSSPAQQNRPNILVLWGDDIGWSNLGCYNHGVMGYGTPNIDRIAKEGVLFTRSLCPALMHGGSGGVHHGAVSHPLGDDDGGVAW